jgi:hypothetical protein
MLSIASRKRAADLLSNETDKESSGSADEGDAHHAQLPPSKVRRIRQSSSPFADSQDAGMVNQFLVWRLIAWMSWTRTTRSTRRRRRRRRRVRVRRRVRRRRRWDKGRKTWREWKRSMLNFLVKR